MRQKPNIKINLKGGLVSPTFLKTVLRIAQWSGVEDVYFGARQQLLFFVHPREMSFFTKKMEQESIIFETDMDTLPNITSSYAFAELFATTSDTWLSEGMYLDIFASFEHAPHLKINICDAAQSHAPFFTGHLNFITSDIPHYWFCYIRYPKTNHIERYPKLIYTHDLAEFSKQIEVLSISDFGFQISEHISPEIRNPKPEILNTEGVIFRDIENDLTIPRFVMPYYEGINALRSGQLWLGIYRRSEDFPINFLIEMCQLCEETRIGNIGISTWRSLVIKGIDKKDRLTWEKLLGKHGINVRHANNELNWQTEDDSPKGAALKRYLVKALDDMDLRTFGLVFAIKTRHKSEVFGSVIIRREPFLKIGNWEFDCFGLLAAYDIFYAHDFNPHSRKRKTFREGIPKSRLPEEIRLLSKKYFKELTTEKKKLRMESDKTQRDVQLDVSTYHRCADCWTIYAHVEGTNTERVNFDDLPDTFECPTCSASKKAFDCLPLLP